MKKKLMLILTILIASIITSNYPIVKTSTASYAVTLISESYNPSTNEHYFEYRVQCFTSPGISHLTFEMNGNCNPDIHDDLIINAGHVSGIPLESGSPEEVDPDPTTSVIGLKYDFDPSIEPSEESVIFFILEGEWVPDGTIPATIKASGDIVLLTPTGPDCLPERGTIIVEKQTDPDGDPQSFTFSGDAAGTIKDGEQIVVGNLLPGAYTSQETVPAGWTLTSIVCDDSNSVGDVNTQTVTFNLEAGETIKAVFTNTIETDEPDLRMLTVTKVTDPGSSNPFDYLDYDSNSFILRDYSITGDVGVFWVVPGSYTFEELAEPGWILDNIDIYGDTDGGSVIDLANRKVTIDIDEGENVDIVFKNKLEPETCTIIVEKIVDWGIDSDYVNSPVFDFTITNPITAFSLGDGETITFLGLSPGEYIVSEDLMGWNQAEIIRQGGGYDDTFFGDSRGVEIEAGETITITFINRPPDFVIPETPFGVIGVLGTMLGVLAILAYRKGTLVFTK